MKTYREIGCDNTLFLQPVQGKTTHNIIVAGIIIVTILVARLYMFAAGVLYENTANKHWQGRRYEARKNHPQNLYAVDSCSQLLRTGDLVLRRGDDMTSYMLSKLNTRDKRFSHCGVVVVEHGKTFVYHSIGGEDNPDQVMKKEPAEKWFSPANNLAFAAYRYNMPDSTLQLFVAKVQEYYHKKVMFDMDFDMQTDERMYCSEMIYKAIQSIAGHSVYINYRHGYGRDFIGVDDLFANSHTNLVCHVRFK